MAANTTLKVNTGIVKRGVKDLEMYRQEVVDGETKLASMPTNDNFYSQTKQALEESRTMVSKTESSLRDALSHLQGKLRGGKENDSDEVDQAREWAQKAEQVL